MLRMVHRVHGVHAMRRGILIVLGFATSTASAQPAYQPVYGGPPPSSATAPVEEEDGPFLFAAGHVGLNAPFGVVGLELGAGLPWLRGSVSVGRGTRGISVGAMGRLVKELGAIDLGLGVGMSLGPGMRLGEQHSDDLVHFGRDTTWLDIEVSIETRLAYGGFTRTYIGVTNPHHLDCDAVNDDDVIEPCDGAQMSELETYDAWPYIGVAFGFRWPQAPKSKPIYTPPPTPFGAPAWPAMPW